MPRSPTWRVTSVSDKRHSSHSRLIGIDKSDIIHSWHSQFQNPSLCKLGHVPNFRRPPSAHSSSIQTSLSPQSGMSDFQFKFARACTSGTPLSRLLIRVVHSWATDGMGGMIVACPSLISLSRYPDPSWVNHDCMSYTSLRTTNHRIPHVSKLNRQAKYNFLLGQSELRELYLI
jgi:hypothetical protein